ncbi:conserved protein of unknown function [Tenacibaculum sp. 190130A14a]|uniref:Uncharacterized protein n=1 Tax=Tenacibaculum polynesiense TaxID=3137857 RepID=A0ABM9P6Q7_9FLAO
MRIFKNIFKKNYTIPEFSRIKSYKNKDKYFIRTQKWDWLNNEQIHVIQKTDGNIKMITMDYWYQEIFLDADGQKTIKENLNRMVQQFIESKMEVPNDLDEMLIQTLDELENELNIIQLIDQKTELKREFELPLSKQQ